MDVEWKRPKPGAIVVLSLTGCLDVLLATLVVMVKFLGFCGVQTIQGLGANGDVYPGREE